MTLPANIPLRRDSPVSAGFGEGADVSGMIALGLVLVVAIFALAWWRKRSGIRQTGTPPAARPFSRWTRWLGGARKLGLTPLRSTRLTAQHSLHEVQWQGKRLLIGCAEQSICLLAESPVANDELPTDAGSPVRGTSQAGAGAP